MSVETFLERLRNQGVVLSSQGDRLNVDAPQGVMTPDLLDMLRKRKAEIIALLCSQAKGDALERRFGHKAARLYPYLGRMVQTPKGGGRLCQVFTVRVGVVREASPEQVTNFEPNEIRPCNNPEGSRTGRPVG